jgi:tRNA-specific 2-thiouridylase
VQQPDHPLLSSREFATEPVHWIAGQSPVTKARLRCTVKTRYRQSDQDCELELLPSGRCLVRTDLAQRAVTPGQSAVFYDGDVCLGGGVIASVRVGDIAAVEPAGVSSL